MQRAQFRPGEDDAVTVNQEILRPHLCTIEWRAGPESTRVGGSSAFFGGAGAAFLARDFAAGRRGALAADAFAFEIRFAPLPFHSDPMLLTHEAVAIGRKGRGAIWNRALRNQPASLPFLASGGRNLVKLDGCHSPASRLKHRSQLCLSPPPSRSPVAMPKILIGISILLHESVACLRVLEYGQGQGFAQRTRDCHHGARSCGHPGAHGERKKIEGAARPNSRRAHEQSDRGRREGEQRRSGTEQGAKRESRDRVQAPGERNPDRRSPEAGGGRHRRRRAGRAGGRFA